MGKGESVSLQSERGFEMTGHIKKMQVLICFLLLPLVLTSCVGTGNTAKPTLSPTPAPTPTFQKTHIVIDGKVVVGGDGQPIELINNLHATNPTFAELVAFLEKDPTDQYPYIAGPPKNAFVCSDFAETVHNNAEAAGIRAAWVGIDIEGRTEGHAITAFETTDLGLVFIDSTGKGLWEDTPQLRQFSGDRRAHVEVGKPYALAGMNTPASEFRFYTEGYSDPAIWKSGTGTYEQRKSAQEALSKWGQTHDMKALRQKWIQEWLKKYEAELSKSGRVLVPRDFAQRWIVNMLDCWEVPWFQPDQALIRADGFIPDGLESYQDAKIEQKLIDVDGLPVAWEVSWKDNEGNWFKPFQVWGQRDLILKGITKDIHVQW